MDTDTPHRTDQAETAGRTRLYAIHNACGRTASTSSWQATCSPSKEPAR